MMEEVNSFELLILLDINSFHNWNYEYITKPLVGGSPSRFSVLQNFSGLHSIESDCIEIIKLQLAWTLGIMDKRRVQKIIMDESYFLVINTCRKENILMFGKRNENHFRNLQLRIF